MPTMPDQPLRVLVVDDNRDNADIICQYLESTREYTVVVAYNGEDALRSFNAARPDLVLLDVMMPGPDGWEVCRAMKRDQAHAGKTRIIMVTARDDLAAKHTALQTGADDFLEKPLDLSRLMAAVRRNAAALAASSASSAGSLKPASPASPASPA